MNFSEIKKVIVVCKTHLDIGFTDYASNVMDRYCNLYIPSALDLAWQVNTPERKRFVWTVGSILPDYYLSHATDEQRARFEEAVRLGYIRWHRLSCTTHTELMDQSLFTYGLSLAERLDQRFGLHTASAKMTDVPGHTIAMVPLLCNHGVEYLHIGVNASSRLPKVPELFRWQLGDKEIIVHYAGGYGADVTLDSGIALEFFHTNDNMGPPTPEQLDAFYEEMEAKYPNALIVAGTLDDFAEALRPEREKLPIIKEEIGDTWIHGLGTDPYKVSCFRRLLQKKEEWLQTGALTEDSPAYQEMMHNLLLVTEHTWGMDVKTHLLDFMHWKKEDFQKARAADHTAYSMLNPGPEEEAVTDWLMPADPAVYEAGSSYSRFEASHKEQRAYVEQAVKALPPALSAQVQDSFFTRIPAFCTEAVFSPVSWDQSGQAVLQLGNWTVALGKHGQITHLEHLTQQISTDCSLGLFSYEIFGGVTTQKCLKDYGRDLPLHQHWANLDFGKPGLQYLPEITDRQWYPEVAGICHQDDQLMILLHIDKEASETYGCPRIIYLCHTFAENEILTQIYCGQKDASRIPEALWLHMNFSSCSNWKIKKMGTWIDPANVVSGGNRQMHGCEAVSADNIVISPLDTPLVSVGRTNLYHVDDAIEDCTQGVWFNLYNNRWDTNFRQWYEEDMGCEFKITFS